MDNYLYVKKFRKKIKDALLESFGNKCTICGYDKCVEAMEFHHSNPKEKEFSISGWTTLDTSTITKEVKKCILICCRCHREVHYNKISNIPTSTFNENIFIDLAIKKSKEETPCEICKTLKNWRQRFCSPKCAAKSKERIDWTKVDLIKELKTKSINKISRELNLSFNAVKKRMIKLGII